MLDKLEAPQIPDSYGISVAYAILLDITRSIGGVIQRTPEMVSYKIFVNSLVLLQNFCFFAASIL